VTTNDAWVGLHNTRNVIFRPELHGGFLLLRIQTRSHGNESAWAAIEDVAEISRHFGVSS